MTISKTCKTRTKQDLYKHYLQTHSAVRPLSTDTQRCSVDYPHMVFVNFRLHVLVSGKVFHLASLLHNITIIISKYLHYL